MYAIVKTGGKQYRVNPGDVIKVDKIDGDVGSDVCFEDVMMVVDRDKDTLAVGQPTLADAKVTAQIVRQTKGDKIIVFRSKRRTGYKKKTGHRQLLTEIKIKDILM